MIYIDENTDTMNLPKTFAGEVVYRNAPRWLKITKPTQTITSYSSKAELCAGLGISVGQLDGLMAGDYVGLRTDTHIMPIQVAGYESYGWQLGAGHFSIDELGAAIVLYVGDSRYSVLYSDYEIHS